MLCGLFGFSKQAYYQYNTARIEEVFTESMILEYVRKLRKDMPRTGGRKIHLSLQEELPEELQIGRDALFDLLRKHGYLIRNRRRGTKTTDSKHRFRTYPNLIKEFVPDGSNQLWVSDITYLSVGYRSFYYLSLITDAYSRKIVGVHLSESLSTEGPLKALKMAMETLPEEVGGLIHHSDRGIQYCSTQYVSALQERGIQISMTENGDPLENAIAERVNGILKEEWLNSMTYSGIKDARAKVSEVVTLYNTKRKHSSIAMLTPDQAHLKTGGLARCWRSYYKKEANRKDAYV